MAAPDYSSGAAAKPEITIKSLEEWENITKTRLHQQFESHIYGTYPRGLQLDVISRKRLPGLHFDGTARVDIMKMKISNPKNGQFREFGLVTVRPDKIAAPLPIIVSQNFCPNHNVIPVDGIPRPDTIGFDCSGDSFLTHVFLFFFGRYITTPPLSEIMARGYGFAAVYPTEFIPDSRKSGLAELESFFSDQPGADRSGALIAWAAQFALVAEHLEQDPDFSASILYGHSRFGKTALMAAAFNPDIDGVIAHQSGTGGASLSRNKPGETIADITNGYPHWFGGKYSSYADNQDDLPIDQHQLIALTAPRPVLLGNARRDVWSDPNGAFRAAHNAHPVYALYGENGMVQPRLSAFDPKSNPSVWIRPGTHGVVKEDWEAFLRFLDHHFK